MKQLIFSLLAVLVINHSANSQKKDGFYYAVVDAGGAYNGFQALSFLGPMGMSCGIVFGGILACGFAFHYENNRSPTPHTPKITLPTGTFTSNYEQAGYNHNLFLSDF
jgi:hypothetical protein